MGTAMYRPYVCRAKLGGERSVSRSERSQRPPFVDEPHICVVIGARPSIALPAGGATRRFRCETSVNPGRNAAVRQQ